MKYENCMLFLVYENYGLDLKNQMYTLIAQFKNFSDAKQFIKRKEKDCPARRYSIFDNRIGEQIYFNYNHSCN